MKFVWFQLVKREDLLLFFITSDINDESLGFGLKTQFEDVTLGSEKLMSSRVLTFSKLSD